MINIERNEDCFGCTACEASCPTQAITMTVDLEGFKYPKVNISKCIDCNKCVRVCPKISREPKTIESFGVYGILNQSEKEYETSSSGGIFIELCKSVIDAEGIVAGAIYDEKFRVIHSISDTIDGCRAFQGSKYTQSDMNGIFDSIRLALKSNRLTLFSGTPCQIAGLRNFLGKDYDNLITCDLICHGVPSPRLFADYIDFLGKSGAVESINMKSKIHNDYRTSIRVIYQNGQSVRGSLKTNIWNKLYFGHYAIRPSCSECPFTSENRVGDLTIGDFWGVHEKIEIIPRDKAISLVLVNTSKGKQLLDSIKSNLMIVPSNFIDASQPSLHVPSRPSPQRNNFWNDYFKHGFEYISSKYCGYTMYGRLRESIKMLFK